MGKEEILDRIQRNNAKGREIIQFIEQQLPELKRAALEKGHQELEAELKKKNEQLKKELDYWMSRVVELENIMGIQQYPLSRLSTELTISSLSTVVTGNELGPVKEVAQSECAPIIGQEAEKNLKPSEDSKKPEKVSKKEKSAKAESKPPTEEREVNVSRLDLRVGLILSAAKHPEADSLYVEQIDIGEPKPRTVVSGLVKFVPLEEMQKRPVVVLCNLKPAKMRGVTSEAMVMCASTPDKVEILSPPKDSVPGDRVACEEFEGDPDAVLPPKKKIFEQVAPDLKTNGECVATYKGKALKVLGKGEVKTASLANVQIK